MKLQRGQVALGILAGGQALRLEGADKALVRHRGEKLLDRTLAALGAGFAQCLLSYNRAPSNELPTAVRVVADLRNDFAGPLAGIEALLDACDAPWLLSVPVDLESIPDDLFEALAGEGHASGVRACDADGLQPLVALWPVPEARAAVGAALQAGEGAVHRVQDSLGFVEHDFAGWRFGNLNTRAELQA
jgi:molybdopterin-guanine dinucleotide biosynthesis protein A